ncbi:MAG: WbuC family cupin fold metalloprotein [Bacteroidales bacterium]|nr:WbuC family cupin fold metalloprotein [Bacteroidales bacterium]
MRKLELITHQLMDTLCQKAEETPRLRMNHNFHPTLDDKVQRFLNAMEPGTVIDIHHHKVDEMLILLQGSVKVLLYNDDKEIIDEAILSAKTENYGVQMPANVWHTVECLEPHTVLFEVKEGPFIKHEDSGILK